MRFYIRRQHVIRGGGGGVLPQHNSKDKPHFFTRTLESQAAYNKRRPQPFNLELFATRVAHQFYKFGRWKYAERQVRRVVVSVRSKGVCELGIPT